MHPKLVIDGVTILGSEDLRRVYEARLSEFGPCPQTLLYTKTPTNHVVKVRHYGRFVQALLNTNPELQILDVGCGFGSLARFVPFSNYLGIDLVPAFIQCAAQTYPGHSFQLGTLAELEVTTDIGVLAGVTASVPDPFGLVRQVWEVSQQGLAVDFNVEPRITAEAANSDTLKFDHDEVMAELATLEATSLTFEEGPYFDLFYLKR